MKKLIIKVIGATLFSLMMIYNISDIHSSLNDNIISLSLLDNRVHAQSETPSHDCPGGSVECAKVNDKTFYKK